MNDAGTLTLWKHQFSQKDEQLSKKDEWLTYQKVGADTGKEEIALERLIKLVRTTFDFRDSIGKPLIGIGHFAGLINIGGGNSLAIKTDGVGTKVFIAQIMDKYDTIGIDCVAMNVNDIICVGAEPLSLVDYIAVQDPDPDLIEQIGKGLVEGCRLARITLVGGEIAIMPEMIQGQREKKGFDLVGMGVGMVSTDKIITGDKIEDGDAILGLASSGIHSNGLTLARNVLLDKMKFSVDDYKDELNRTLGEELLEPTKIYVKEILEMISNGLRVKALAHITSAGFLNLQRVTKNYGFRINSLPEVPPIFKLIQEFGPVTPEEMYEVYNMGIGFCVILPQDEVDDAMQIAGKHDSDSYKIGHAFKDPEKKVIIEEIGLVGTVDRFYPV